MVRCEVIQSFTLERFDELKNIKRIGEDTPGKLNVGDKFECTNELASYLLGENAKKKTVIKVMEVVPDEVPNEVKELKKELQKFGNEAYANKLLKSSKKTSKKTSKK